MMRIATRLLQPQQQQATQKALTNKVLVANRGEIACRVFETGKALGYGTVAVYCEAEPNSKHVQSADESYCIGQAGAANSYLKGEKIIEAAKKAGAGSKSNVFIHPGYGFLSENAEFAEAVRKAEGVEWVGPPAAAITSMGSKSESKIIMTKAGVPVVPGYHGEDQTDATLMDHAVNKIGFPLLIKAVSGGGGKGMKIVRSKEEFMEALNSARREAINFFKDDRVLLEKFIEYPRHVECQVFCDSHSNGVFFFERDCSVQRRYQKVLEEAPAPHLSDEERRRIGDIAVRAARAVDYVGAGTVEFIYDTLNGDVFFMEMNTRLQVEHPVTEEVTRVKGQPLDLVQLQLKVASGEPLGFTQDDITVEGHCIEARVFAENPKENFLPGSGHLTYVSEPAAVDTVVPILNGVKTTDADKSGVPRIRLDTGFRKGDDVLVHYDPMIAKLIVWGATREKAIAALRSALDTYHLIGITTNIDFLKACCDHPTFKEGGFSTKFIEQHKDALFAQMEAEDCSNVDLTSDATSKNHSVVTAIAAYEHAVGMHGTSSVSNFAPFRMNGASGRSGGAATYTVPFALNIINDESNANADQNKTAATSLLNLQVTFENNSSEEALVTLTNTSTKAFLWQHRVTRGDNSASKSKGHLKALFVSPSDASAEGQQRISYEVIDGRSMLNEDVSHRNFIAVSIPGNGGSLAKFSLRGLNPKTFGNIKLKDGDAGDSAREIHAPMPGKVTKFLVADGETVEVGQKVMIIEAMKMEHPLMAGAAGVVKFSQNITEGAQVAADAVLATIAK